MPNSISNSISNTVSNIVVLSGWHCPVTALQPLAELLAAHYHAEIVYFDYQQNNDLTMPQWLAQQHLPDDSLLLGWSLGGLLANHLAALQADKVTALITLASNTAFVNEQTGMPKSTFNEFFDNFSQQPRLTFKRFQALMSSDKAERAWLKNILAAYDVGEASTRSRLQWLEIEMLKINLPWFAIIADQDRLVPVLAQRPLAQFGASVHIMNQASHVFFYSQLLATAEAITAYVKQIPNRSIL